MQGEKKYPLHYKIRTIDKIFGANLFPAGSKTKNRLTVARNLNIVAFVISVAYAAFLFITGRMARNFPDVFTSFLPAAFCVITDLLFRRQKLYIGLLFTFTMVPLAITVKGIYAPIAGMMLFPLTYGIVSFFVIHTPRLLYPIYAISALCFTITDVAYHKKYNQYFNDNISLIIFNDILFALLVYTVLSYIRNLLGKLQNQYKEKEQELFLQNTELREYREEIDSQNLILKQQKKLFIESWHLRQKITSVLSHDTRTSLIFLKHILHNSKNIAGTPTETLAILQDLEEEVWVMTKEFDNILQWLKNPSFDESKEKEEISLYDVIEEILFVYKNHAKMKKVTMHNKVENDVKIYVSPECLKVIMRNLIGNAIKFSKTGGLVQIWTESDSSYTKIFVKDDGVGISDENMRKIKNGISFTTSGTRSESGKGMGLVFCRDFIERSDGQLDIVSNIDQGTTAIVSFALTADK